MNKLITFFSRFKNRYMMNTESTLDEAPIPSSSQIAEKNGWTSTMVHPALRYKFEWNQIKFDEKLGPFPMYSHALTTDGKNIYLFGGIGTHYSNKLYKFSFKSGWSRIREDEQNCPRKRAGHTCVHMNRCLYVFMGYYGNQYYDDVHSFDLRKQKWRKYVTKRRPINRSGHTTIVDPIGDRIILFGGATTAIVGTSFKTLLFFSNIWEFSPKKEEWNYIMCSGGPPTSRCSHSACLINNKMIIYGGKGLNGEMIFDMWALDLSSYFWSFIEQKGEIPKKVNSACVYKDEFLVLFGGLNEDNEMDNNIHLFHFGDSKWGKITTESGPKGRKKHAAVLIGNKMIVFGGCRNNDELCERLNDFWQIKIFRGISKFQRNALKKILTSPMLSDVKFNFFE